LTVVAVPAANGLFHGPQTPLHPLQRSAVETFLYLFNNIKKNEKIVQINWTSYSVTHITVFSKEAGTATVLHFRDLLVSSHQSGPFLHPNIYTHSTSVTLPKN